MTTYILHGGETTKDTPENELFFTYFSQFVDKDEVRILMCYFTKDKKIWDARLEQDRKKIESHATKKISLSLAQDSDDLLQKIDTHDVLYVAGGDPHPIESYLPQFKNLKGKLQDKVYLGCSMGAFIVSSQYVLSFDKQDTYKVHYGLGLLPISILCHWDIEKKKEEKIQLLKQANPESPILTLNERKFAMFIY